MLTVGTALGGHPDHGPPALSSPGLGDPPSIPPEWDPGVLRSSETLPVRTPADEHSRVSESLGEGQGRSPAKWTSGGFARARKAPQRRCLSTPRTGFGGRRGEVPSHSECLCRAWPGFALWCPRRSRCSANSSPAPPAAPARQPWLTPPGRTESWRAGCRRGWRSRHFCALSELDGGSGGGGRAFRQQSGPHPHAGRAKCGPGGLWRGRVWGWGRLSVGWGYGREALGDRGSSCVLCSEPQHPLRRRDPFSAESVQCRT